MNMNWLYVPGIAIGEPAATARASCHGTALDTQPLVADRAPLRRCQTYVDDVLPAAGLAALSHVTSHGHPMDARLLCNSSFALGEVAGNETCRTKSTECLPTSNLFGALQVGTTSAAWPPCSRFGLAAGQGDLYYQHR